MRSRLLAGGLLLASALIAWLAISFTLIARILQAAIGLSLLYVGYLAWRGWQVMRKAIRTPALPADGDVPWITVVVPASNEAGVIGALVADLVGQDYRSIDGPRFDVLVVDDGSSDGTASVAETAAAGSAARVRVTRREPGDAPRTKGAVLAWAHPHVSGEILCVVDADSRLAPDFLSRSIAAWRRDARAAALQVQRRAVNRSSGWLAAGQDEEQLMDMASQCGRWATDGTAELRGNGMLVRVEALAAVGGWSPNALTEDLELSTRLTAHGNRVTLAPEVDVSEQAVEAVGPLWRQRMRWAEGSLRRLIELGPGLVANRNLPFGRRLDFVLFVGEFLIPPLFVTSIAASLVTVPLPAPADWTVPVTLFLGYGLGTYLLALAGLAATGARPLPLLGGSVRGALFLSHWLLIVPAALLRITLGPPTTQFEQTPRSGEGQALDR
ncbi:MAG TPA: glycosyltransferase family 2 protein [Candidatus Limnocylindria bacterium]|nr:glycosyltransferase family 2 protein [Candidatus Limnocylindria bacterium]